PRSYCAPDGDGRPSKDLPTSSARTIRPTGSVPSGSGCCCGRSLPRRAGRTKTSTSTTGSWPPSAGPPCWSPPSGYSAEPGYTRLGRRQAEVPPALAMLRSRGSTIGRLVDQAVRGHHQVSPQLFVRLRVQRDLVERGAHVTQPGIAFRLPDGESRVAHPQPRMAALLAVSARATPILDQEQPEVFGGRTQVTTGVDRPQHRIGLDLGGEPADH